MEKNFFQMGRKEEDLLVKDIFMTKIMIYFFPPKPFNSWVKDIENVMWKAPVDRPDDDEYYVWDEPSGSWINAEKPLNNYE